MPQPAAGLTPGAGDDRPLLFLIATGDRRGREYLFPTLSQRFRLHLLNTLEPTWELGYLSGFTLVPSTELTDLLPAARRLAEQERPAGVLTWHEPLIHQVALLATELHLPTSDPDAVWRCRDKHRTRVALAAAGVAQPRFALVSDVAQALEAAASIGYPVVLKPRAAAASFGVVRVEDAAALARHFDFAAAARVEHVPSYDRAVLVEECLDEPEISIDSAVFGGTVHPAFVARKQLGFFPYFEEVGHVVDAADPLLTDKTMLTALQAVHTALGYTLGWTHAEFKLTAAGPKLIEVNGRLGGDLIPYLGRLATGTDAGVAAATLACGQLPPVLPTRRLASAIRFFYPTHDDTTVEAICFDDLTAVPGIDSTMVLVEPGAEVSPPPKGIISGRLGYATATGTTEQDCLQALDAAQAGLRLTERVGVATR